MCKKLDKDFSSSQELLTGLFDAVSTYLNYTKKKKCYNMISGDLYADLGIEVGSTGWSIQVSVISSVGYKSIHYRHILKFIVLESLSPKIQKLRL